MDYMDGFNGQNQNEEKDSDVATAGSREELNKKLRQIFDGKIVRKDLTKHIKEGANVPIYVLEYLLGQYCNSDDEAIIERGVETVKSILANNYVRPDEAQKVLSVLRKKGSHTVIDLITVELNMKYDEYEATFSNLGLTRIPISEDYPEQYDRLLCGGIWCIVQLEYGAEDDDFGEVDDYGAEQRQKKSKQKNDTPVSITKLTPIQMPNVDLNQLKEGRKAFSKEEWIDVMLRSTGMEPDELTYREKWLLLTRMLPLVENNFNLCELGPRSTGKSHLYKEISPNSILVSGGQTTVANLFYNMSRRTMGLVGLWDVVAFDEVAGINFKDKDGIQIMKDYMASGSFARGKEEKAASASMVFVGNINQSVDVLLKTSSLFDPFPPEMGTDTAFLDRMHCYNPGWEIPKFRPEHFTNDYGFITDYLAGFIRELRKVQFGDAIDKYFRLGKNLNQRDTIAVRRMVDGYLKLLYPNGEFGKEEVAEVLEISLEMRRRVKEQLKKLGGMEFYDVNFSYIDMEDMGEHYVSVPEQGGGKLIPEGMCNPGQVYTISHGKSDMIGVFRLESQMLPGNGKFDRTGLGSDRECKEAVDTAFNFLKANGNRISGSLATMNKDFVINYQDLQGIGMTKKLALPTLIALCSIALGRPVQSSMAVIGDFSIGGTIMKADNLASTLQVCLDSGAKKILLPQTSAVDLGTVPAELMSSFSLVFYQSAEDAVFKALGVE
ncbi:ATP-dependent Lon protease [Oribacterium sp. KHPX15]|nr:protease Lon-related BREX system protein BrxL [Oribacterium sp. KHPX15]SEA17841.1 ATP-dependent Lon protease [Oribacterium sp. KHPX15]